MTKPWEDVPDLWADEKAYCNWLRSQSRRIWSRHPIKNRYKADRTVLISEIPTLKEYAAFTKKHPRAKKACKCEICGVYSPASKTEVDHIDEAGSFSTVAEWKDWLDRLLLLGFSGIRLLDKDCHLKVTLSQRFKCKFEDVWVYQEIAAFNKMNATQQCKALFALVGCHAAPNGARRKALFKKHMMEKIECI